MPAMLSVAVVSKGGVEALRACLGHVRGIAGEMCVVDTRGFDPLVPVVREFQGKTSAFLWCDDPAQEWNEALRLCSGDWVMTLTPGERLSDKDLEAVARLVRGATDLCHVLEVRRYTDATDCEGFTPAPPGDAMAREYPGWVSSPEVRLFPNRAQVVFEGDSPCSPRGSLERLGVRVAEPGLVIHQYPEKVNGDPPAAKNAPQRTAGDKAPDTAQAYRGALQENPSDTVALRGLGQALRKSGQTADALDVLQRAVRLDPHNPEGWQALSLAHLDRQEWGTAQDCLERAVVLDPSWLEGRRLLSMALERQGLFGDAADEARRAFESMPRSQDCLKLYIHLMLRLERREEAREVILDMVNRGVEDPTLHNAVAELYFYDKMYEESKRHFRAAGELGLAGAYNNLGVVYFSMNELAAARDAFDRCLLLEPGHAGALSNREKLARRLSETGG
jgi:tetratricopeptide (TPR) repeat protein